MEKNEGKLVIHYHRDRADYSNWSLWLWEIPQRVGKQFEFDGKDSFGVTCTIKLSTWTKNALYNNVGLIVKSTKSWDKKDGTDKYIKFYKMEPDRGGNYHVYVLQGDDALYANEKLKRIATFEYAKFLDFKTVAFKTYDDFTEYRITKDKKVILEKALSEPTNEVKVELEKEINFDHDYRVEVKLKKNGNLDHRRIRYAPLYKLEKFQKQYYFDGELGAICEGNTTTFRVWSPVSRKVVLRVYKSGTPLDYDPTNGNDDLVIEQEMEKAENGVFSAKISRNLHGFYYTYVVTNDVYKAREIVDIYAKSAGVNGFRGMVVDFSKIKEDLSDVKIHPYSSRQLTIYETHVVDLTSSKTWSNDKKARKLEKTFLGACLEGTKYEENGRLVTTGFDHVKELGVNAVQLLPIFDQANDEINFKFNWGYNPLNYNVLEGSYSTDPHNGEVRINEFKKLVRKYNEAGINIIMDVVYNHVYAAVGCNFDVLMPGYYFRYVKDRVFSNGSGCGNETASEMPMFRKFMIDSVLFWAKEYKIAGFRFDLMAIHDLETMNELAKKVHEYNPNIVLFGEPWMADRSTLPPEKAAHKGNANKYKGYGFFSDSMRDSLVRTSKDIRSAGWCGNYLTSSESDQKRIAEGIKGTAGDVLDPNKIVNYASCHDNRTLFDRVKFDGITNEKDAKRVALLANSIVLTSNGIAFMLAGEEFCRTKGGSDNSYNLSFRVNELDYSLKLHNIDTFKVYQKLIALKQKVFDLSLDKELNTLLNVDISRPNVITYDLDEGESGRKFKVIHVNGYRTGPVVMNLSGYNLYLDTINSHKELSNSVSLIPYETLIAYK